MWQSVKQRIKEKVWTISGNSAINEKLDLILSRGMQEQALASHPAGPPTEDLGFQVGRARQEGAASMLAAAEEEAWFGVKFNGVDLHLPKYTLLTMYHCLHFPEKSRPVLLVETAHWNKLKSWLEDGTVFLDVGAATGAMCVPFDLSVDKNIRIAAFEPSRRTRGFLEKTVARNQCRRIEVYPYALSGEDGTQQFAELPMDPNGQCPFLPERSHLSFDGDNLVPEGTDLYSVSVRTLDSLQGELKLAEASKLVVKIDVEGFEADVLRGARQITEQHRPVFAIDIHLKPGQKTIDTEQDVRDVLAPFNYKFERLNHVLLVTPLA